jgi:hemerythrin-like metal-binding protein
MRPFHWSKAHGVAVPEIDAEHQAIFRLGEELNRMVLARAPIEEIRVTLQLLTKAVEGHFAYEESLMQSWRYPIYDWHRQQHDTARKRLALWSPLIEEGDTEAGRMLLRFLNGWLRDHTQLTDRMLGAFLRNANRAHAAS